MSAREYRTASEARGGLLAVRDAPQVAFGDRVEIQDARENRRTGQVIRADADEALEREPNLELGWLSALNARNAAGDYRGTVEALTRLEGDFGYDLGPENLKKSKVFGDLMASEPFQAWLASRPAQ